MQNVPFDVVGDVLVLAGDIGYLCDKTPPCPKFWEWASANYREVLIVPGNHEYYQNYDILANGDSWSHEILPNVHYHQNKVVRIDNVDFILSTLWSHIRPQTIVPIHTDAPKQFSDIFVNDNVKCLDDNEVLYL